MTMSIANNNDTLYTYMDICKISEEQSGNPSEQSKMSPTHMVHIFIIRCVNK